MSDVPIHLVPGKAVLVLSGAVPSPTGGTQTGRGTYVTVSCTEVVEASLDGRVHLSRDWVVPAPDTFNVTDTAARARNVAQAQDTTRRVTARFDVDLMDDGFFAQTTIDGPFVFPQRPDVVLRIADLVVDMSDLRNFTGMRRPRGYHGPEVAGRRFKNTWRGIYLSEVSVKLEGELASEREPFTGGAEGLIIDETGLSVGLFAENVLPYGERRLGNWDFSVDGLRLEVLHSNFEEVEINGRVTVPLLAKSSAGCGGGASDGVDSTSAFRYRGIFGRRGFEVGIALDEDYCIPAWKAQDVVIERNSSLTFGRDERGVFAASVLHGNVNVSRPSEGSAFNADGITFDNLEVATRAPYFSPGYWSVPNAVTAQARGL